MAMKTCPKCKKQAGPRTKQCECGHNFGEMAAVSASSQMMSDPLNDALKDSVEQHKQAIGSAKNILARAAERKSVGIPKPWDDDDDAVVTEKRSSVKEPNAPEATGQAPLRKHTGRHLTYVPAGDCPYKPEGYNRVTMYNYDEQVPDEIVKNWAIRVYNSGDFHPNAVIYWAREFWNINDLQETNGVRILGERWRRIRGLIFSALCPSDHNSVVDEED